MRSRSGAGLTTAILLSLVMASGCKKPATEAPPSPPPGGGGQMMSPGGAGGAGGGVMSAFATGVRVIELTDLKQLVLAYKSQADNNPNGRGPKSLDDFKDLKRDLPKVYEAIKEGDYVIIWGVNPNSAPAGASNTVIGHVKDVATKGGVVVFLDGSARKVQPDEFKTLTIAK